MHLKFVINKLLPIITISICVGLPALAARITQVTTKQVKIDAEGTELHEGDRFFAIVDGKKRAVIVITRVSKGKAIGKIAKGKASVDATLEPTGQPATVGEEAPPSDDGASSDQPTSKSKRKKRTRVASRNSNTVYVGVLAGYGMDSQTVTVANGSSVSTAGSGYSLKAYGNIPISGSMGLVARTGVEQLNLTGSSGGANYSTSIMYLTADVLARFNMSTGGFVPFASAGVGLHFPLSKSSNDLDESKISATFVFFANLGFNIMMDGNSCITLLAEYGMFPPSDQVSTSFIALRGGYGWRW